MKAILTDVDDVLLDWCTGFHEYVTKDLEMKLKSDKPGSWNLSEWLPDGSDVLGLVKAFNSSARFGKLNAYDDAREVVSALHGKGYTLIAITSCSSDMFVRVERLNNLEEHFPDMIGALFCLDLGESKERFLNMFTPTWWIEDKFESAMLGKNIGHRSIILTRDHNKNDHDDGVIRCHSWHEIHERIIHG